MLIFRRRNRRTMTSQRSFKMTCRRLYWKPRKKKKRSVWCDFTAKKNRSNFDSCSGVDFKTCRTWRDRQGAGRNHFRQQSQDTFGGRKERRIMIALTSSQSVAALDFCVAFLFKRIIRIFICTRSTRDENSRCVFSVLF